MNINKSEQFNFLSTLLKRNNLIDPNGQPLFQYQLTEQDYRLLLSILRQYSQPPSRSELDKTYCALFCLFAAEWFRRDYRGGWTWKPIWEALGYSLGQSERGYLVFKGLSEYWSRPVSQYSDDRFSLLGSVFREGGLPFRMLSGDGSRVQEVFKYILKNIDSAKLLGRTTYDLTKSQLTALPEAFQQETTIDLVADMVERLIHLVDRYQLTEQEDPARYLDSQFQNWRRLFPIPLDEKIGTDFLNALLVSATKNRIAKTQLEPISCVHTQFKGESFQLKACVTLAESIQLPINRDQLTSARVELFVFEGLHPIESLGAAYIRFEVSSTILNPRLRACEFKRRDIEQCLWLVVKQAGQTIYKVEIPNSDLAISSMPIGLVCRDDEWVVCGAGSFSKKASEIRLVFPSETNCDASNATITEKGFFGDFEYICFSGVMCLNMADDRYRVSNTSDVVFEDLVRINGPTLQYSTSAGQPIYLGFPRIECNDAQAELWISGRRYSAVDRPISTMGYQTIKLKTKDGTTLHYKRLAVLPTDFKINLIPGANPSEGAIQLCTTANFYTGLTPAEGVSSSQKREGGNKIIQLKANEGPPSTLTLSINANLEAKPILISVPFPAQGVIAFDKHNNTLARELIVDELLGSRLIIFPKLKGVQVCSLELVANIKSATARFDWVYRVSDTPMEISLYEMRGYIGELFSLNPDDLDAIVTMRISYDSFTRTFLVKRYACETTVDNCGTAIVYRGGRGALHVSCDAIPLVMDLADPKCKPRPLKALESEGVPTGYYESVKASNTTQLIVPAPDSSVYFRARLVSNDIASASQPISSSLYTAVNHYHPINNPLVIQSVIEQMAREYDHSGWQYVHDLFQNFQYLPLTTFQVWKDIAKNPLALAMLAFRLENAVSIVDRLQSEFNVLWDWIPLDTWTFAFKKFNAHWECIGLPEVAKGAIIKSKFEQLSKCIYLFRKELEHLVLGLPSSIKLPVVSVMNSVVGIWYQDLRNIHDNGSRWPDEYSVELTRWYSSYKGESLHINAHLGYHKSVLFLPVFAAAVVSGKAKLTDVFVGNSMSRFFIRKIANFDRQWFFPIYQYCLEANISRGQA